MSRIWLEGERSEGREGMPAEPCTVVFLAAPGKGGRGGCRWRA